MKLIFFGSSDFSLPPLEACLESGVETALVVTTPDQKKGRGLQALANPVRQFCAASGLPCEAPETLKQAPALERVRALAPDIFVVASYGKMIPSAWLALPAQRLNIHPSLLPRYRGAAPLNWPILEGEQETGVSIAEITPKLDSGDIFYQEKIPLAADMDSEKLGQLLSQRAAQALRKLLEELRQGKALPRTVQDESRASTARKLTKEDGRLEWSEEAVIWDRKIRGLKPWPGAYVFFNNEPLAILEAQAAGGAAQAAPGTILEIEKSGAVCVQAGKSVLRIFKVKPAGRTAMSAADFVRGRRLERGFSLAAASA